MFLCEDFLSINLKQSWNSGLLKLEEPSIGYKDRIVAPAYGSFIATKLENKLAKQNQDDYDSSWDNIKSLCY